MSTKFVTFCFVATSLFAGATGCAIARGLGPGLPALGDSSAAAKYVYVWNIALSNGNLVEAQTDYQAALKASPFNEDATIGLARCSAAEGDYADALSKYQSVIDHNKDDIDWITEYVLVLQQAGSIPKAIFYYNHALDLCKRGLSAVPMDIYPSNFNPDGSDYNATELAAMSHIMRALNASNDDMIQKTSEIEKAQELAPQSSIVYFYRGVLLQDSKKPGARQAFKEALALDNGSSAKIINKWIKLAHG